MISEEAKSRIDALSEDELRSEINLGDKFRLQREKFTYAQSRLSELERIRGQNEEQTSKPYLERYSVILPIIVAVILAIIGWVFIDNNQPTPSIELNTEKGNIVKNGSYTEKGNIYYIENHAEKETINKNETPAADREKIVYIENQSDNLYIKHGILNKDILENSLYSLREERKLRKLSVQEDGYEIHESPPGTAFYAFSFHLDCNSGRKYPEDLPACPLNNVFKRLFKGAAYFEIHHLHNRKFELIGFVDEGTAFKLSKIPDTTAMSFTISTLPWEQMTTLISFPLNLIIDSKGRKLALDKPDAITGEKEIYVLDISL